MRARLASLLFGGSCFLCRGAASALLCEACAADLPRLPRPLCPRCALPSPRGEPCGRCLAEPPRYDATVAALTYAFPADALIQALKFRGELSLAPLLSDLLRERIPPGGKIDCVIPVPLSRRRLKERGYNQAVEIASRFKRSVESHDWSRDEPRLAARPVNVDVGVVCLRIGPVSERRGVARKLAAELIQRADKLMYDAKGRKSVHVHHTAVRVSNGRLVDLAFEREDRDQSRAAAG